MYQQQENQGAGQTAPKARAGDFPHTVHGARPGVLPHHGGYRLAQGPARHGDQGIYLQPDAGRGGDRHAECVAHTR